MDALKLAVAAVLLAGTQAVAAPTPVATTTTPPSIRAGVERWRAGDYPAAVAMWAPFAASGDADAMFNMGQAYKLGRGVPQDAVQARDFYRKAAIKGHLPAQANLGIALFQVGEKPEAIKWLRTAADRGEARAQYVLGIAAFNGDGLPRSQALGYGYLLRAQASGLPQAATALGSITPALSPADRTAGDAVAASLAAGTGVPAALAAMTAPKLIAAAPGILKPPVATASLPVRTPPQVEVAATAPKPAVVAAASPKPASVDATAPKPLVATSTPPKAVPAEVAASKPQPAPTPPKVAPVEVAAAKPIPTPTPAQAAAAARGPVVGPVVATTDVPASKPAEPAKPKPVAVVAKPDAAPLKPFETAVAPAPKKPDGWRVQLGAFSQRKLAEAAWAEAKGAAGSAKPIYNADGTVVKLQMGPFANRDAAKAACGKLTEAGRACFVTQG